jgi:hypothetical protein
MNLDTVQLIKCLVSNQENQASYRIIEKDNYDLWRYLVTTKHHLSIKETQLCLWVIQEEFDNKFEIYQRAGTIEPANRILLMTYDDHGSFHNVCRYTLEPDTQNVKSILHRHIPEQQREHKQYTLDVEAGQLVTSQVTGSTNFQAEAFSP